MDLPEWGQIGGSQDAERIYRCKQRNDFQEGSPSSSCVQCDFYLTHNTIHQFRNFDVHSTPSTRNRLGSWAVTSSCSSILIPSGRNAESNLAFSRKGWEVETLFKKPFHHSSHSKDDEFLRNAINSAFLWAIDKLSQLEPTKSRQHLNRQHV